MSDEAGKSGGPSLGIAGAAAAVVIGIGLYFFGVFTPSGPDTDVSDQSGTADTTETAAADDTPTTAESVTEGTAESTAAATVENAVEPAAEDAVEGTVETTAEDATEPAAEEAAEASAGLADLPAPPAIDVFRLEPDGGMLVAGQTHPQWETTILVDGVAVATVAPDGSGQFVEFLDLDYSDQPRVLSLLMRAPDGQAEVASTSEIILAPLRAPVEVVALDDATDEAAEGGSDGTGTAAGAGSETTGTATAGQTSQAVLLSDESGVRVLQAPEPSDKAPEVMSAVALDAITYSDEGQVQLSGRAQGSGSVRVYLDNAPIITSKIEGSGSWTSELPEVDTGVYTLRIDEVDDAGRVTSRVETPFKREDEEVVAQAQAEAAQASTPVTVVTVQKGSTLWAISRDAYGEGILYVRVFEANADRIRDPDLIYPGQIFTIPE